MIPPDPEGGWSEAVEEVEGALIIPPRDAATWRHTGVIGPDGRPVDAARTWRAGRPAHEDPLTPLPQAGETLAGAWLWGGPLYWHFGHFLTESATRLWAQAAGARGVIFTPKRHGAGMKLLDWQRDFLRLSESPGAGMMISRPMRVERLIVPGQGFGLGRMAKGTASFRAHIREHFAAAIAPEGGSRLYLSRSRFGPRKGGLLGEDALEAALAAEGYEILHPETAPLETQIARLKAAEMIVAPDGSALHLAGLAARPETRVAIVLRRRAVATASLPIQLSQVIGAKPVVVDAIAREWTDAGAGDRLSYAELDFTALRERLGEAGFVTGADDWSGPDAQAVARRVRQLGRRRGRPLTPSP